jgi:uncharacterized membrane protein HdeD (DUF308 family)
MSGWIFMLIAGVIALVGGIFALFNPLAATGMAAWLTATLFIAVGIIEIIGVFGATGWGGRIWSLILGALTIFLGAWMFANPIASILALTWLVGILFLATGATKVILSFGVRGTGYFWIVLLSGILSIVLAVMVLSNFPYSAAVVLGTLLAVELISSGAANIALALRLRETGPKAA